MTSQASLKSALLSVEPSHASIDTALAGAPRSAQAAMRLLKNLKKGSLLVHFPNGQTHRFGQVDGVPVSFVLRNWNVCAAAIKSGDIGFAESYIAGDWTTPDLAGLLGLFVMNRREIEDVIYGKWWGRLAYQIKHLLNRNSKSNAKKNIHAHYDLGNGFYEMWLDPTMNYSSAWFNSDHGQDMSTAQDAKVRRALNMARVKPGDRVLEIGCGWGALAEKTTTEFGAHITGVTLSSEQLAWANARLVRQGAAAHADLRLQDYRDISDAPFDAIASIEMIEAVGMGFWPEYFATVARLLKPGGYACIQSITIADELFDRYIAGTDFIQQYIFPGGCLPSPSAFKSHAQAAGLEVVDEFAFGPDYAETLRRWRKAFMAQSAQVLALSPRSEGLNTGAGASPGVKRFDEAFIRTWEFYLAYCEAAFDQGNTDVMQFTLRKPV